MTASIEAVLKFWLAYCTTIVIPFYERSFKVTISLNSISIY
jgi:hypothetical protein